tara:strand:+ start:972 stop:1715 length:744 start_codon:yes stop_codon:yes gene_type:complete
MVDNNINVVKLTNSIFIIQNLFPFEDCDKFARDIFFTENDKISHGTEQNVEGYEINLDIYHNPQMESKNRELIYLLNNILIENVIPKMITILKEVNKNIYLSVDNIASQGLVLRKITGNTRYHVDQIGGSFGSRLLSIIIALNENYDDGIITFPDQGIDIKLKKSEILVFPPYWTHPHKVSCPQKNDRYTITFWLVNNSNCKNKEDEHDTDSVCDSIYSEGDSISIFSDIDEWSVGTDNRDIASDFI